MMANGDYAVGVACLLIVGFFLGFHARPEPQCAEQLEDGRKLLSVTRWLQGSDLDGTKLRCMYQGPTWRKS